MDNIAVLCITMQDLLPQKSRMQKLFRLAPGSDNAIEFPILQYPVEMSPGLKDCTPSAPMGF